MAKDNTDDITDSVIDALSGVTTATLTTLLLKKGLRGVWMRGTRPLQAASRAWWDASSRCASCRPARTWPRRNRGVRRAPPARRSKAMPAGCIAVVNAMGCTDAGIFGDILCARIRRRRVAGLVTDGVVRDGDGVLATGLPVWCQGIAAPPSVAGLTFVGWQEPIGCGGVAVFPDDLVVADGDGAVAIPSALVAEMAAAGPEQSTSRPGSWPRWKAARRCRGLYPPNDETRARYEASRVVHR